MLRNDIVKNPTSHQIESLTNKKTKSSAQVVIAANRAELEREPMEAFTDDELDHAKNLLADEMEFVKQKMAHSDLPIDAYSKVWEECYNQVSLSNRK